MQKIHLVFFGTPKFAATILKSIVNHQSLIIDFVVTQPDKPVGRKHTLTPSPVKIFAQKHHLPVHDYTDSQEIINLFKKHRPGLAVVAAFGKILPQEILKIPKFKTLGVHPSLLPKYRGPTPIQAAILNGDRETGVTIFLMDEKIDHGKIILNTKYQILNTRVTSEELSEELARLGGRLLIKTVQRWIAGKIRPQPQDHQKATFTKLLTKKDGFIQWENLLLAVQDGKQAQRASIKIDRMVRALNPWPGVWTKIKFEIRNSTHSTSSGLMLSQVEASKFETKRLKILKAHLEQGKLVLDQVQLEGKKPVSWKEFERGYPKLTPQ